MGQEVYADLAAATVGSGGNTAPAPGTPETWTVAVAVAFPSPASGQQFHFADTTPGLNTEIVEVDGPQSGTTGPQTWNVTRGAYGTTPVLHSPPFPVKQIVPAEVLAGFVDQSSPQTVASKTFTDSAETVVTLPAAAGAVTIDLSQGNVYALTVAGNVTSTTLVNAPAGGACRVDLYIAMDATGGWTVQWPAGVVWLGGVPPSDNMAAGQDTVVSLALVAGTWYGAAPAGAPPLPLAVANGGTGSVNRNFAGLLAPTPVKTPTNSPYAAQPGDFIPVDATLGGVAVNLPPSPPDLTAVAVALEKVSGSFGVTVNCQGTDTFDASGAASLTLASAGQGAVFQYSAVGAVAGTTGVWYRQASGGGGGFANPMTGTGDMIVGGSAGAGAKLAADTTNTRKFLRQQSTGGVAAAPAWDVLQAADVPSLTAFYDAAGAAAAAQAAAEAYALAAFVLQSAVGAAGGVAGLDAAGRLPATQLPAEGQIVQRILFV